MTAKRRTDTPPSPKLASNGRRKRAKPQTPRGKSKSVEKVASDRRTRAAARAGAAKTPIQAAKRERPEKSATVSAEKPHASRGRPHERARARREALLAVTDDVRRSPQGKGRRGSSARGDSRKGKKTITIFLHPLAKSLIDAISYQTGTSVQDLGIEAINLLLIAYDRKPIA